MEKEYAREKRLMRFIKYRKQVAFSAAQEANTIATRRTGETALLARPSWKTENRLIFQKNRPDLQFNLELQLPFTWALWDRGQAQSSDIAALPEEAKSRSFPL
ncbi:hypothetical protein [Phaeobacter sp. 11ANDIMAR09]|uniref:hypothetical protein n=1 Tax=Phaeobacter sp. 11ANDIMAR09 TaxID=1225647 RepID=UPI0006C89BC6|nr:hypothetical protein [Phaeobacter sp. 11ANDIMAR09]KPD12644.1 hypothetical protein AN476_08705 [Phaeobacter sp. 11ANDIMAR09]